MGHEKQGKKGLRLMAASDFCCSRGTQTLLLDEHTAALDPKTAAKVLN